MLNLEFFTRYKDLAARKTVDYSKMLIECYVLCFIILVEYVTFDFPSDILWATISAATCIDVQICSTWTAKTQTWFEFTKATANVWLYRDAFGSTNNWVIYFGVMIFRKFNAIENNAFVRKQFAIGNIGRVQEMTWQLCRLH